MTRLLLAAVKVSAITALLLAGSSCTTPHTVYGAPDRGGAWPGWTNTDQGGFEEMGWVLWPATGTYQGGAAGFRDAKAANVWHGTRYYSGAVDYEFYIKRTGLARLCPFTSYIPLRVSGEVPANRIVLDQAAASGEIVHISGRQWSGLAPGAAYVQVTRATHMKPAKRIAW